VDLREKDVRFWIYFTFSGPCIGMCLRIVKSAPRWSLLRKFWISFNCFWDRTCDRLCVISVIHRGVSEFRSSWKLRSIDGSYRRFGTTYPSHLRVSSSPLKMGPIDCPKTSVRNYHYLLHNNNSEQHNSHKFLTSFHGFLAAWVKV
jgi:hypothetical protein